MSNTGQVFSPPRPTSLLVVAAAVSAAMCFCIASATHDGYTGTAVGANPWLTSRFLAAVAKKGDSCSAGDPGACSGEKSSERLKCCNGTCTDVLTSGGNCGACGALCVLDKLCCGGRCTALEFDAENCGSCGQACPAGVPCKFAMCGYA